MIYAVIALYVIGAGSHFFWWLCLLEPEATFRRIVRLVLLAVAWPLTTTVMIVVAGISGLLTKVVR